MRINGPLLDRYPIERPHNVHHLVFDRLIYRIDFKGVDQMAGGEGPSEVELNHNMVDQGQGTLRRQMLEKQRRELLVRPLNPSLLSMTG